MNAVRAWRHRGWQAVVVVVGVAAATQLRDRVPKPEDAQRPFLTRPAADGTASLRGLDVTVEGIDGAKTLGVAPYLRPSNGVWVVVEVRLHAVSEPVALGSAQLADDDGNVYGASGRFTQTMLQTEVQPGADVEGPIAFEVPVEALDGLRFRAAIGNQETRLDLQTDIPLKVSADDASRWTADDTQLTPEPRAVVA